MLAVGIEHDDLPDVDRLSLLDPSHHEPVSSGIPAGRKQGLPFNPAEPSDQADEQPPSTSSPYATRCTGLDVVDGSPDWSGEGRRTRALPPRRSDAKIAAQSTSTNITNAGTPNGAPTTSATSPSRKTVAIERTGTAAHVAKVVSRRRTNRATSAPEQRGPPLRRRELSRVPPAEPSDVASDATSRPLGSIWMESLQSHVASNSEAY
jgi:hypothetical protein